MRKFVIFCQARTGTHLLRTSLEQHPGVRCFWEPFNDKAVQHFPYTLNTPADDILQMLWRPRPGVLAAGFPLHLTHGRNGRAWGEIWEILAHDLSLVRIHLYRRNLLQQLISHTIALHTGDWMQEIDPSKDRHSCITTVRLDAEYCHNWFNSIAKTVRAQQQSMPDALTITYEELSQDLSKTAATVFREIGLEPVAVEPRIRKQGRPPEAALRNFKQLQEIFAHTQWQSFFVDTLTHTWDYDIQHAGARALPD